MFKLNQNSYLLRGMAFQEEEILQKKPDWMLLELECGVPTKKTFLDIRIMHPNSPSYVNKPIEEVYVAHEQEKKRNYNERVLQIERGSFTPIVGSTFGGWGNEADKHHKRIATLIHCFEEE